MQQSDTSATAYSFVLETAELAGPGIITSDIKNLIIDIDIFESIEKQYLTGIVIMLDDNNLYSQINFTGIQTLKLGFRLPEKEYKTVYKKFYIDKIVKNIRATDREASIMFHIIEDIGFVSEYINVNKALSGKGSEIITNLVRDYFDRTVKFIDQDQITESQQPFKIIVPNLTPIETINWVLDRMSADDGSPFYIYSTLSGVEIGDDKTNSGLFLKNWQTMFKQLNRVQYPFTFSSAEVNRTSASIEQQMFIIQSHYDNDVGDITTINDSGFINSKFLFHDVNTNRTYIPGYDQVTVNSASNQSLPYGKRWTANGMMDHVLNDVLLTNGIRDKYPRSGRIPFNLNTDPNERNASSNPLIHTRPESRLISQVYSSSTQDINHYAYLEGRSDVEHLTKINSKALKNWINFSPLTFAVPGRLFLNGSKNASVGVKYNLQFVSGSGSNIIEDKHKSGDYIVFAARHVFSRDAGYTVHLTGVKIKGNKTAAELAPPPPLPFTTGGSGRI
jgi:hypothetical protein